MSSLSLDNPLISTRIDLACILFKYKKFLILSGRKDDAHLLQAFKIVSAQLVDIQSAQRLSGRDSFFNAESSPYFTKEYKEETEFIADLHKTVSVLVYDNFTESLRSCSEEVRKLLDDLLKG